MSRMDKEMKAALEADGEKLRQLTGEDHGPWEVTMADSKANDKQGYHKFQGEEYHERGSGDYGSFEVFWSDTGQTESGYEGTASDVGDAGWYCCLPDGGVTGPFATSQDAYDDAQLIGYLGTPEGA